MRLRVRVVDVLTGGPFIAILNSKDAEVLDVNALDRVRLRNKREIVCVADVSEGKEVVKPGEVVLFLDVARELGTKKGESVDVLPKEKPRSLVLIKKKLDGGVLSEKEVNAIVKDIVENALSEVETTFFVAGCYRNGMSLDESAFLTRAIVRNGGRLTFKKRFVLDKHSIGGVSGNRTTPIVVSIVAAAGFLIPKTSTRSITSPVGTSDCVEVLAPVAHSKKQIMRIVKKTNGCMVWGGTLDFASADDKLIKIERPLSLDPEGILLASILAKKSAANSTHIVIDIPVGKEAKIRSRRQAMELARKFVSLGEKLGMKVKPVITDGSQPIGWGVGAALEARDVLEVLTGCGPEDLRKKSLFLAGTLLGMVNVRNSFGKAKEILESGAALAKMREIIAAQGGNEKVVPQDIALGKFRYEVHAKVSGVVAEISNNCVSRLAKAAGAPNDKGAGVFLHRKVGEKVKKGGVLFTVYAESQEKLKYVRSLLDCETFVIR